MEIYKTYRIASNMQQYRIIRTVQLLQSADTCCAAAAKYRYVLCSCCKVQIRAVQLLQSADTCCAAAAKCRYVLCSCCKVQIRAVQLLQSTDTCCAAAAKYRYVLCSWCKVQIRAVQLLQSTDTCCAAAAKYRYVLAAAARGKGFSSHGEMFWPLLSSWDFNMKQTLNKIQTAFNFRCICKFFYSSSSLDLLRRTSFLKRSASNLGWKISTMWIFSAS